MPSTTSQPVASNNPKDPNFDPAAGSTVNIGIEEDEAFVPDVTDHMKETAFVSIMTPMGDPYDEKCIWGAPVCYWGLPAVAKSDKIEQAAIEANLNYATIYPGQRQPEDFSGVLVPDGKGGVTIECLLGAVRYLNGLGRGVIFLDEMNAATRATQGALLGFIQKRVIGDNYLAPGVRILAAANPPKWSTSGFTLASATSSRMCHLQVKCPPVDDWCNFMIEEDVRPQFDSQMTEETIRKGWGAAYSHVKALFVGYMKHRRVTLHMHPDINSAQAGFCWANPRTWRLAARMKATADILKVDQNVSYKLIEGCVGEGAAFDYSNWVRNANLPHPEDVIQKGWVPDVRRPDVAFAVVASVNQYVVSIQEREPQVHAAIGAWKLYQNLITANMGDMTVSAAQVLVHKKLSRSHDDRIRVVADPVVRWMANNNMLRYVDP
jgi:hypothetical protein